MIYPWIYYESSMDIPWISHGYSSMNHEYPVDIPRLQNDQNCNGPSKPLCHWSHRWSQALMCHIWCHLQLKPLKLLSPRQLAIAGSLSRFDQIKSHRHKAIISKKYTGAIYLYMYLKISWHIHTFFILFHIVYIYTCQAMEYRLWL